MGREHELMIYAFETHGWKLRTHEAREVACQYQRCFEDLRDKGYEFKVHHYTDKGKPVYAHPTEIKGINEYIILRIPKEEDSVYRREKPSPVHRPGQVTSQDKKLSGVGGFLFGMTQHGEFV